MEQIHTIISTIEVLAASAGINTMYLKTILKIIGIAYIAEFASHITKDAGMGAMAAKVELAGKILILSLAVPILTVLIDTIIHMMPVR